ncbi:ATP-binding cassette domain-containing protein [Paenibacillus physcomitrellae]|uniref:Multidrug ABC transporter ATP-binding protein n=1 Tax=Paenibacillus physcomitrellae TaxID=1619311 RepID=A0ABQ1FPG8_9BACL|nr:ATP-binding cassette domain-containing protein [Paenibacillus physcomitrellae]GGA23801.1 multidrug ABC transporter ATP-binding protein [Paenibacillus physcomitrellae]
MTTAIKISNLNKSFKHEVILQNVSLEIEQGKITGFIGHNGSGKSVFFKLICGLLLPDTGSIEIFEKKLGKEMDFPEDSGAVIEHPGFLPDKSGFQNLKYLASIRRTITDEQIKKSMIDVGLDPENPKKVKGYSLGMKQRLAIAQAIMEKPKLLILDEPMNGLDKDGVSLIRDLLLKLKSEGVTILLSSHITEDIRVLCDKVYEFENKQPIPVNFNAMI